jgi:hypothetical protein
VRRGTAQRRVPWCTDIATAGSKKCGCNRLAPFAASVIEPVEDEHMMRCISSSVIAGKVFTFAENVLSLNALSRVQTIG